MPQAAQPGEFGTQPLKALLAQKRLTQRQAAEAVRLNVNTISMIVNGQTMPTLRVASQLADLVGKRIEDVFTDKMLGRERRPRAYKAQIVRAGQGWRFRCECGTNGMWVDEEDEAKRLSRQHQSRKHPR